MKKVIITVSSLIVLCSLLSSVVFADVFNYKRSTGKFSAWYDSSVASYGYTGKLDWARSQWNGISSNVSIGYSSSNTSSTDEYYVGTSSTPHLYGHTEMYIHHWYGNSSTDPDSATWDYSVISIYDNNLAADGYKNDTNIKHTTTHEVGHSIGLAHTTDTSNKSTSVMTAGDEADRSVISPSTYDKNQLKSIWRN